VPREAIAEDELSPGSTSDGIESDDYESDASTDSSLSTHMASPYSDLEPSTSNTTPMAATWSLPVEASNDLAGCSYAQQATNGGRFSKSADEREVILKDRKDQLIETNRRKYLASLRADDLKEWDEETDALRSPNTRRRLVLSAIERRMRPRLSSNET